MGSSRRTLLRSCRPRWVDIGCGLVFDQGAKQLGHRASVKDARHPLHTRGVAVCDHALEQLGHRASVNASRHLLHTRGGFIGMTTYQPILFVRQR
jgi:hypothetical protein